MSLRLPVVCLGLALVAQQCAGLTDEYIEEAKKWKKQNTRSSFFAEFNKDRDPPVTGPRADRLWNYINEQLDYGGIVFKEGGTMVYSLPMTHFVPLPDFFVDLIDMGLKPLRRVYYFVMDAISDNAHEHHHNFLEFLEGLGALIVIQGTVVAILAYSFLHWAVYRFTDGIFPEERKLAKQTKRLAADYMAKKNN